MQAAYEEFGCNAGNTFFIGIDKGNNNNDVMAFDSIYGIHYPGVSGNQGGGNIVHLLYDVQSTPTIVVIRPDRSIAVKQVYPPSYQKVVDSVLMAGGIPQACMAGTTGLMKEAGFTVNPNPVSSNALIRFNLPEDDWLNFKIFNATGRLTTETGKQYYAAGKQILEVDFTGMSVGVYLIQAINKRGITITQKVIFSR